LGEVEVRPVKRRRAPQRRTAAITMQAATKPRP
jgi:hypothetical protein